MSMEETDKPVDRTAVDERKHSILAPRDQRGFATGVLLMALGIAMLVLVWSYPVGTATRMAAGYWPRIVAYLLIGVGFLNVIVAYFAHRRTEVSLPPMRQMLLVPIGILLFGFTVERLGFIIASALLIGVAALASRESRLVETIVLAVGLITFCSVLFVTLLGLSIRLVPPGVF